MNQIFAKLFIRNQSLLAFTIVKDVCWHCNSNASWLYVPAYLWQLGTISIYIYYRSCCCKCKIWVKTLGNDDNTRRVFWQNLETSLMIQYLKKRAKVKNLKSVIVSKINDVLVSSSEVVYQILKKMKIILMIKAKSATFALKYLWNRR